MIGRIFQLVNPKQKIFILTSSVVACFSELTHIDPVTNLPKMVDVGEKAKTSRNALASCKIKLPDDVWDLLFKDSTPSQSTSPTSDHTSTESFKTQIQDVLTKKGPLMSTSVIAGTMGAKQTSSLIPFCHPLNLTNISINHSLDSTSKSILISCQVGCQGETGVEMESLVGVSVSALTIYDMIKGFFKIKSLFFQFSFISIF